MLINYFYYNLHFLKDAFDISLKYQLWFMSKFVRVVKIYASNRYCLKCLALGFLDKNFITFKFKLIPK